MKTSPKARFSSFTPKSKHSFPKEEKLKSSQQIAAVFAHALSINSYPLLVFYKPIEQQNQNPPAQAAFTVSKKKFKRAVDRNRIKRLMREAYRLQKHKFYEANTEQALQFVFVYTANKIESYQLVEKKMTKLIDQLLEFSLNQ